MTYALLSRSTGGVNGPATMVEPLDDRALGIVIIANLAPWFYLVFAAVGRPTTFTTAMIDHGGDHLRGGAQRKGGACLVYATS
jgi:hypothetical protein